MPKFSQPCRKSLFAGSPPGPFDPHQHKRTRSQRTPESLLPIPCVDDLSRDGYFAFLRQLPEPAGYVSGIHRGLIQRNAIWNDMNIDQPYSRVEIVSQTCGIFQSCPCKLGCSMRDNNLKIGNRSRCKIAYRIAVANCFVLHT